MQNAFLYLCRLISIIQDTYYMAGKHKYGQYFTIRSIADFMVTLITHTKESRVLEPSCGKGVFLDCLLQHGFSNLNAYEIDKSLGTDYDFVQFKSFLSIPVSEKYSVIIGNPPYIRWKNLEPELKSELGKSELWNKYFNSLCDYLFVFILKSIEHLEDNGELIFICTEYWMNTTHSLTLRNYMCTHGYFSEIYHFKEAPLFEKVTASFVIFRFVKSKQHPSMIRLYDYTNGNVLPTAEELRTRSCFSIKEIPHFKENNRWILATLEVQDNLKNLELNCVKPSTNLFETELYRVRDFCDIGNGMVSGLDAAFQLNQTVGLNQAEQEHLVPVMKAKQLNAYKGEGTTNYIFIQEEMDDAAFTERFPHFAEHFKEFKDKLNLRYNYNRKIPYWQFVFPRNQKLFERAEPRIFVPCKERISNKNHFRFCYAPAGCYPTQDVTAVFRNAHCKESLEYVLAYLNNERVFEWLKYNGIVKGAIVEFSESPIASIPYRPIDWRNAKETDIHQRISQEVRCYLSDSDESHLQVINTSFNELFDA